MTSHACFHTRIDAGQIAHAFREDPALFAAVINRLRDGDGWDAPDFGFAAARAEVTKGETVALQLCLKALAAGATRALKELA